jgi:hypothetical protein
MVSVAQSSIFLSPNTMVDMRIDICFHLHIENEALSDKYLRLITWWVTIGVTAFSSF